MIRSHISTRVHVWRMRMEQGSDVAVVMMRQVVWIGLKLLAFVAIHLTVLVLAAYMFAASVAFVTTGAYRGDRAGVILIVGGAAGVLAAMAVLGAWFQRLRERIHAGIH